MSPKIIIKSVFAFCIMFFSVVAFADILPSLTIINKFGENLNFQITSRNGNEYAPGFPVEFSLSNNGSIQSSIKKAPTDCIGRSTYIKVLPSVENALPPEAFFATGIECPYNAGPLHNVVAVSGYVSRDIAYSWKNGKHPVLTLCQAKDYPCQ